ncbi:hypothetical protein [Fulvitalea axinellae]
MKIIEKEMKCSNQAVRMSLQYVYNSEKSKAIRKRAKELLLKEGNDVIIDLEDINN